MYQKKQISLNKSLALLMSTMILLTTVFSGTFAHLITKTPSFINTFLSGINPTGDLVISKKVTHPFGDSYSIPEGLTFDFNVSLGESYAGKAVITSQGEKTTDQNGNITFSIAHDAAVRIYDLATKTNVIITENAKAGFTPVDGDLQKVTICSGENHVAYVNDYKPNPVNPVNMLINGTKVLEGREWQEGDTFTFLLEYKQAKDKEWKAVGESSVVYELVETTDPLSGTVRYEPKPDFDKFSFTELVQKMKYDTAGEYSFRLSEAAGSIPGITYDKVVSYFDVIVGDKDMDGALEIQNVTGHQNAIATYDEVANQFSVDLTVNNKYAPVGSATATIKINKIVKSLSGEEKSKEGYTFELYDEEENLITTSGATSGAGETYIDLHFEAKDAGKVFRYTLKETNGGKTLNGMRYDDTIYLIEVSVVDNLDGTISAYVYDAEKKQNESAEAEDSFEDVTNIYNVSFVNEYNPDDVSVSINGKKELTGRDLKAGEFTFKLYVADDNYAVSEDATPIQTVKNAADGSLGFKPIKYDKVGTYRYVAMEDDSDKLSGITYDKAVFRVTLVVTDENGKLNVTTRITDELGAATDLVFRNHYKATPIAIRFTGKKVLNGMELKADMFRFLLFKADKNFEIQGTGVAGAYNDATGKFSFDNIICYEPGITYFVVKEDVSIEIEGMTYDDTVYGIQVETWDDDTGNLKSKMVISEVGGSEVDEIIFENSYKEPIEPEKPDTPVDPENPDVPMEPEKPDTPAEPEEPDGPKDPTESDKQELPNTGDNSNGELYLALVIISVLVIGVLVKIRKKNK